MTLSDTPPDSATVLAAVDRLITRLPPSETPFDQFRAAQFDAGLAWVHAPVGRGGLGVDAQLQDEVDARLAEAGADLDTYWRNGIALTLVAPLLLACGTRAQQEAHLRRIFTCEEIWCQLFSEPGAGSDLAALTTRGVLQPDGSWVLNGQKVWSTLAHVADHGVALVRTGPEISGSRGISCFIVDLKDVPGVEVRGIRDITGEIEFNEVFFRDVEVPAAALLGAPGDGWGIIQAVLSLERAASFLISLERGSGAIGYALEMWHRQVRRDDARCDGLTRLWVDAEVLRLISLRLQAGARENPLGAGVAAKLLFAENTQAVYDFCLSLLGDDGLLFESLEFRTRHDIGRLTGPDIPRMYLRSHALTIEGGTSDIMRNIIGERVLGLPREPRVR